MGKQSVIALSLALLCLLQNAASEFNSTDEVSSGLPAISIANTDDVSQSTNTAGQNLTSSPKLSEDNVTIATNVSNGDSQPLQSKICETCVCQEGSPFVINCSNKGLSGVFLHSDWPLAIHVSSIEVIFDSNNFEEITQFPELPITKLSYRANNINFIQKEAFKYLQSLEYLDVSENSLTHEALTSSIFEGKFNDEDYEPIPLRTLKLGYNKITSIDKDAFDHLSTHLEELELNNNPMKMIDHPTAMTITTLRKLKKLNLAETNLTSIPSGVFHALSELHKLNLSGNLFTSVPEDLKHATHLEYLNLNNNPIEIFDAKSFEGLTHLKVLKISSMLSLKKIDINTFTPLSAMTHLWCSYNPSLTQIHPGAFNNMIETDKTFQLSEVHFRGNNLKNFSKSLLPWDSLELVDIGGNPFTCDCGIGWIVKDLLPLIQEKKPELTQNMKCALPEEYKGRLLDSLDTVEKIVNCTCTEGHHDEHQDRGSRSNSSNKGLIVISVFAIFAVVGGMTCFVLLAVKKTNLRQLYDTSSGQIVHYIRTPGGTKPEDEHIIVEKEFSQYHEEP